MPKWQLEKCEMGASVSDVFMFIFLKLQETVDGLLYVQQPFQPSAICHSVDASHVGICKKCGCVNSAAQEGAVLGDGEQDTWRYNCRSLAVISMSMDRVVVAGSTKC